MTKYLLVVLAVVFSTAIFSCSKSDVQKTTNTSGNTKTDTIGKTPTDTTKKDTTTKSTVNPVNKWVDNFYASNILIGSNTGRNMVTDAQGNIYVLSTFQKNLYPNTPGQTVAYYTVNGSSLFLAKYDASGKYQWTQQFDCTQFYTDYSLAIDASGNLYLAGAYTGGITFNQASLILVGSSTAQQGFIIKCNNAGQPVWETSIADSKKLIVYDIAVDAGGQVYAIGRYFGQLFFANTPVGMPMADNQCFVAKYSSAGKNIWGLPIFGIVSVFDFGSIAIDKNNAPVFGLTGSGDIYFEDVNQKVYQNKQLTPDNYAFIGKLTTDGEYQWLNMYNTNQMSNVTGLAIGSDNSIYYSGFSQLTGAHTNLLGKLSAAGSSLWSNKLATSLSDDEKNLLALDGGDNVYNMGFYSGTLSAAGQTFTSTVQSIYLFKYTSNGTFSLGRKITGDGANDGLEPAGLTVDVNNNIDISGYYFGTINNLSGSKLPTTQYEKFFTAQFIVK